MGLHVLIAEPHDLARGGLRTLFISIQVVDAVYEVATSEELNRYLTTHQLVDLVVAHQSLITDFTLLPKGHFVILADKLDQIKLFTALTEGARGYLLENAWSELFLVILKIAQKEGESIFLLDPTITPVMLDCAKNSMVSSVSTDTLTSREREVFLLLHKSLTDSEIAAKLCISQATVRTHITNILHKLHITRGQAKQIPPPDDCS